MNLLGFVEKRKNLYILKLDFVTVTKINILVPFLIQGITRHNKVKKIYNTLELTKWHGYSGCYKFAQNTLSATTGMLSQSCEQVTP